MTPFVAVLVVLGWLAVGVTTSWWMARWGHDPRWTFVALALGPLFVPIALERVERGPRPAASGPGTPDEGTGPRVLVGLDGSAESDRVLTTALELLGPRCRRLLLVEVVGLDTSGGLADPTLRAAEGRLVRAAEIAQRAGVPALFQVLTGSPASTLRHLAEEQDMDLVVVGRRGLGLSPQVLGSVSADLLHHSRVPVLVVEPALDEPVGRLAPRMAAAQPLR